MRMKLILLAIVLCLLSGSPDPSFADPAIPKKKQTALGLYITAGEAFAQWRANPDGVHILDVRTPSEYIFVGHALMARNIPVRFFSGDLDVVKMGPVMPWNESFVQEVKNRYGETDTIMVMCRSGGRSAAAVNKLAEAGFKRVYNIIDGFEGDGIRSRDPQQNGKRIVNGWRNAGAPWTYGLAPDLVYRP